VKARYSFFVIISGEVLAGFPILAALVFSAIGSVASKRFLLDWFMPADLFMMALPGGGLLLLGAFLIKRRRAVIGATLGACVASLGGGQVYAMASGIAEGIVQPGKVAEFLLLGSVALYTIFLATLVVLGAFLIGDGLRAMRTEA
jgi:hypothetical protein